MICRPLIWLVNISFQLFSRNFAYESLTLTYSPRAQEYSTCWFVNMALFKLLRVPFKVNVTHKQFIYSKLCFGHQTIAVKEVLSTEPNDLKHSTVTVKVGKLVKRAIIEEINVPNVGRYSNQNANKFCCTASYSAIISHKLKKYLSSLSQLYYFQSSLSGVGIKFPTTRRLISRQI